jgi:hypothetical protein
VRAASSAPRTIYGALACCRSHVRFLAFSLSLSLSLSLCLLSAYILSFVSQAMRSNHQGAERRERAKSVNTVAARMKQVVEKMIQAQRSEEPRPQATVFLYKSQQSEITNAFFQELQKENPVLFRHRDDFLSLIAARYDEFITVLAT